MGMTPINQIPYPEGTDAPDITAHFAAAAAVIDHKTVKRYANAAERDGINTSPLEGELAYLEDGGGIHYNGTDWVSIGQRRTVLKTTVETTSSTALQDDNQLSVTLGKNGIYDLDIFMIYSSSTSVIGYAMYFQVTSTQTVDMACDFTTVQSAPSTPISQANFLSSFNTYTTNFTIGLGGDGNKKFVARFKLPYITGASNELLKIQWCQHPDGDAAASASVHPGSHMVVKRISQTV